MKTVVLCAGKGTRLYPLTDFTPKAMIYVGGKPVLRRIVDRLVSYGFYDILLCVNHKDHPMFFDYFDDGSRFGASINYSLSTKPLGTVGEVLNVRDHLNEDFLLYYGDTLTKVDLHKIKKVHDQVKTHGGYATLALIQKFKLEVGTVEWIPENGVGPRIVDFKEKPLLSKTVWAGIAIISPKALKYAKIGDDFGADLFPRLLLKEKKIYGVLSNSEYYDVGTLSHYRKVCKLAEEGKL